MFPLLRASPICGRCYCAAAQGRRFACPMHQSVAVARAMTVGFGFNYVASFAKMRLNCIILTTPGAQQLKNLAIRLLKPLQHIAYNTQSSACQTGTQIIHAQRHLLDHGLWYEV